PKKVITNDDLDTSAPVVAPADKPADAPASTEAKPATSDPKPATETVAKDVKIAPPKAIDWQKKVDEQEKVVGDLDHELNLMEREQQVRVATYYADAGNQLRDSKKWFEDQKKYEDTHAAKQQQLAAAKQKLDDMKEEARKAGTPVKE